jgi:hypothetical protein
MKPTNAKSELKTKPRPIPSQAEKLQQFAKIYQPSTQEPQQRTKPLTVRNIAGIMSYEPDEQDLILVNGYFCKGERTVWLGQGGLGKSRLSIQFACCCALEKDFLGTSTRGQGLRWLFLQTENGMRRLKYDLERMKTQYSDTEWETIEQHIFFHTLEADEDGIILLNEVTHFERAQELVLRVRADVIVFDPLRDSHGGDLNGDQEMTLATRNLTRLAKVGGRTDRGLLVLHHSLTGKAGAAKATGFDRASFGRNSKVLQGWTRAQVNFAPGSAENNNVLVVASGKNNNFKEFQPYAIELDPMTMSYRVKPDFDFGLWEAAMAGKKQESSIEHEALAILKGAGGRMEKKVLIDKVQEKAGRGGLAVRDALKAMTASGLIQEVKEARSGMRAAVFIELCETKPVDLDVDGF